MEELYGALHTVSGNHYYYRDQPAPLTAVPPPPPPPDHLPDQNKNSINLIFPAVINNYYDHDDRNILSFGSTGRSISGSSSSINNSTGGLHDHDLRNDEFSSAIRLKIASHPLYPKLLQGYIDCQKVGAPPEIVRLLDGVRPGSHAIYKRTTDDVVSSSDPELDDFMETYCGIMTKYKSDLARSFDEATSFLNTIETQLKTLCNDVPTTSYVSDDAAGPSDDDLSAGEIDLQECPHQTNGDRELKEKLLRKYSGYISTLKQEFSKKKKKGKLPKDARQILLDWWNLHYKWPYPTEGDKVGLAELTGLYQKQINNWFINQRKRHWKPSENMQYAVMDSLYGCSFCD